MGSVLDLKISPLGQLPQETGKDGDFKRQKSKFRNWVSRDKNSQFPAEVGRYHLYVSFACPWAHRTIIFRKLKKLEKVISLSIVDPLRDYLGWKFTDFDGEFPDRVNKFLYLSEAYIMSDPEFNGRVTVPVLWDKKSKQIVNNESSDIIRMMNSEFNEFTKSTEDFYPDNLTDEIDKINQFIYSQINNGVYKTGFATTQIAYEDAFGNLFRALDKLELRLSNNSYLVGEHITEADWRLFTTLVRFDSVYYNHFKCNLKRIIDYPNLWRYTRILYQIPGIKETVNMDHIKRHYYMTHSRINPSKIVPMGPNIDFSL